MSKHVLNSAVAISFFLACGSPARAASEPAPLESPFEWIEPTTLMDVIGNIDFKASPTPDSHEFSDAMAQFTDPKAALDKLSKLRKGTGAQRAFVIFRTTHSPGPTDGEVNIVCGVAPVAAQPPDDIVGNASAFATDSDISAQFGNFKRSSRADRVRSIARCLRNLTGTLTLKPAPRPPLRSLYIDDASYAAAERWIRQSDPHGYQGTSAQYQHAFRCILTRLAETHPEATGDAVVVQSITETQSPPAPPPSFLDEQNKDHSDSAPASYTAHHYVISIVPDGEPAKALFSAHHTEDLNGLWVSQYGLDSPGFYSDGISDPIAMALGREGRPFLHECRSRAGLLETPSERVPASASKAVRGR